MKISDTKPTLVTLLLLGCVLAFHAPLKAQSEPPKVHDNLYQALNDLTTQLLAPLDAKPELQQSLAQQVAVVDFYNPSQPTRLMMSELLEQGLAAALVRQSGGTVINHAQVSRLKAQNWRSFLGPPQLEQLLEIAGKLQVSSFVVGTWRFSQNHYLLTARWLTLPTGNLISAAQVTLENSAFDEKALSPQPLYQNLHHLATAATFILNQNYQQALAELEQIPVDQSPESIRAQGMKFWILAHKREPIQDGFVPFQTAHPDHPMTRAVQKEVQKQTLFQKIETAISNKDWWQAASLMRGDVRTLAKPDELLIYQSQTQAIAVEHLKSLIQQSDWESLRNDWELVRQSFNIEQWNSLQTLQRERRLTFIRQVQGIIERYDRLQAQQLLTQFGSDLLISADINRLQVLIDTIPQAPPGMITVPTRRFEMGHPQGQAYENHLHLVTVTAFHLDQHEVTQQQYRACVLEKHCAVHSLATDSRFNDSNQPVIGVTWYQAKAFCDWKKKRLPTEAEWTSAITLADALPPLAETAWYAENSGGRTRHVGSKQAVGRGFYDMLGNALEWVSDYFAEDYYHWSPETDPKGPQEGEFRVARGGSFHHNQEDLCPQCRFYLSPDISFEYTGFRCAKDLFAE